MPPRDDRHLHASGLIQQIRAAERQTQSDAAVKPTAVRPKGIVLDFQSDPGFKLQLRSLEMRRSGIELLNSRIVDQVMYATVFIPEGKTSIFVRKLEKYAKDTPAGKPKNKGFAESITAIRLGALESFWTDAGAFPTERNRPLWWEVWLRDDTTLRDVAERFRDNCTIARYYCRPS